MRVGKSPATAILGTHVPVVFLSIPVARPAREVPFILVTVVELVLLPVPSKEEPVEVTSPVRVPIVRAVARAVAVQALPDTLVWSHVLVPLEVPVTVPPPVAKSAPVKAVLNSARLPVIPTIDVWSPVFVPLNVPVAPSAIVIPLFCMSLPVVESNLAIALSVAEAGHTTSPVPHAVAAIVTVPELPVPPVVRVIFEPSMSCTLPPEDERVTV